MLNKSTCPSAVAIGEVLKERNGDRIYIVLRTGRNSRWTYLIDIEHEAKSASRRKASPFKIKTDDLLLRLSPNVEPELALEKLSALPCNVDNRRQVLPFALSRRSKIYREIAMDPRKSRGWKIIEGLLTFDQPPRENGFSPESIIFGDPFEEVLDRRTKRKRILRYCEIAGVSESTVYRTLRRYLQQGMTPAAASDDYDRCGGPGKQRILKRAPGRMPTRRRRKAAARDQEVLRLLQLAVDYYFSFKYSKGKRSQKTLKQALSWLQATFLKDRAVYNERKELVELKLNHHIVITVRQLQYYKNKNYSYEERRIHKVGLRQYLLHERPLTGRLRTSRGPGERYHIDATVLDIYLIGQVLRTRVIGRPVLYLVIDDYSSMVVGFYLTFDPPNWDGAMMALANAISPKVTFCRSLGIEISEDQWPCSRLCEVLFADQGEVSSIHKASPLITHFRVEVSNAPAYRPDLRSVMERRFGIIPAIWNAQVPGIVEKGSFDRGVQHPAYHAALDIMQLRRVICYSLLSYNRRIIRGYPVPPEMVDRELAPTPLNLWTYGTEINGYGRHVDVDDFRARVMPKATVPIDGQGIWHNGMHYECPTLSLVERQAMFRAQKIETSVEIGFDSADNSSIQLHGLSEPITCPLSECEIEKLRGLTYKEQNLYKELNRTSIGMAEEAEEAHRAMTDYNIAHIAEDAVSKTAAELKQAGMTRPDITNIDEMRASERRAEAGGRGTGGSIKTSKRRKTGASLKRFIRKYQKLESEASLKKQVIYDEEGDAHEESLTTGRLPLDEAGRMTTKDLRERRARELLQAMDA